MSNNNLQQTTFWLFLNKYKIEIPIIQRDYAQGRLGKEKLRETFLKDLKNALDGNLPNNENTLKLDFVYGSVENGCLNPLDGQQRLTTLWLLHLYIAYKAGILAEHANVFKKFSYETRITSREFCQQLAESKLESNISIVDSIQKQTCFYSVWKQDPTIQAMLNMLGGTTVKDHKENDILDGIEEVFINCNYLDYWKKLTGEKCPIIFYYLDIFDLSLSDDLYIKMNARGKTLTSFENFKADLVGFIKDKENDKNPEETITHKLDTTWTDIFWKNRSSDYKIDDIYFAFINRYLLNNLLTAKKADESDLYTQNEIESNKLFKYLYGESGNDSRMRYNSFDIYKAENELLDDNSLKCLNNFFDNFYFSFKDIDKKEIDLLFLPSWDCNSSFRFIPEYEEGVKANEDSNASRNISLLTQSHRAIFYAICCYFENNKYNDVAFKKWMRIVWNIVENANITTIASMIGTMRLIDKLKPYANDIYTFLADEDSVIKSETAKEQVIEEIEKAKQIINDLSGTWETKIIEAERTAFFKGAIRFLFRTDLKTYDWSKFDERFAKTNLYFDKNGVTTLYKSDTKLLRYLISMFDKWDYFNPEGSAFYYDNEISSWMIVLAHVKYIVPINRFFDGDVLEYDYQNFVSPMNDKLKLFHEDIVRSSVLSKIFTGCTFHWWNYGGYYSLYPYNTKSKSKIFVFADKRNEVLSKLEEEKIIKVDDWQRINGLPFYKGWEIYFTLNSNNKKYRWWGNLKVQDENNKWVDIETPNVNLDNLETYFKELSKIPEEADIELLTT